jgi:hypothetical protein
MGLAEPLLHGPLGRLEGLIARSKRNAPAERLMAAAGARAYIAPDQTGRADEQNSEFR